MFKAFCMIDGIEGESTDREHRNWIEILSYSHGITRTPSDRIGTGEGVSKSGHEDFSIAKALDKASPKLALACCQGEHIPKVVMELCRIGDDGQKFMEYEMEDVIITSVRPRGTADGQQEMPVEELSFNYKKIIFTYTEIDPRSGGSAGYIQTHWDVERNTGG